MNIKSHQNKLIECFSIFLYLLSMVYISEGSSCDNFSKCVPLERCSSFYNMMQRTLSSKEKKYLQEHVCDRTTHSVCCPIDLPNHSECGIYFPSPDRIYGGVDTRLDEFPWMALIKWKGGSFRDQLCGGSLINKRYVLTAAHCIKYLNENTLQEENIPLDSVRLGEYDKTKNIDCQNNTCNDPPVEVKIENVILHKDYSVRNHKNDIALLRLAKEVDYTKYISPVCLPLKDSLRNNVFDELTTLTVVGWGNIESGRSSKVKQKAYVPSYNRRRCNRKFSIDINKQVCAGGEDGVDSCQGDSGGPLLALNNENINDPRYYVAGLVSYGAQTCGLKGSPTVHTRVGAYIDWILENIEP